MQNVTPQGHWRSGSSKLAMELVALLEAFGASQAHESQTETRYQMVDHVDPEPCFRKYKGGYPQLFLAGTVPY